MDVPPRCVNSALGKTLNAANVFIRRAGLSTIEL
jgi:hypothetical protein